MSAWEAVRMALSSLFANKGRSALTVLGVVIGIMSVIALMGVGQGAQDAVMGSVEELGSNLLYVRPDEGVAGADPLSDGDVTAVAAVPGVAAVAPETSVGATVTYRGVTLTPVVTGTTPSWPAIRNAGVATGRFFDEGEVDQAARVAVVGSGVAADLGVDDLLGEKISVGGLPFVVVGVLESRGGVGGYSPDDMVLIPSTTALMRLTGGDDYDGISIQVADADLMGTTEAEIVTLLRARHHVETDAEPDFTITSQAAVLETAGYVTSILTALLASIAGISLLVGGIGIMNIMLVSVTERTRDIGIRKAIGAQRRDIMGQFLIESVVLSLLGGVLGVVAGVLLSRVLGGFVGFEAVITIESVLLAAGVAGGIGVFFGVYPAWKASRQDPIEALRYE